MSTRFYITPFDPNAWEDPDDHSPKPTSDLRIEPSEYREGLIARWHGVTFLPGDLPEWNLPPEDSRYSGLSGYLQDNLQIVSFGTGPKQSFLDYVLWHRGFVPESYPLFLSNSSSWDSLILTRNTTEQDIIDFTGIVD